MISTNSIDFTFILIMMALFLTLPRLFSAEDYSVRPEIKIDLKAGSKISVRETISKEVFRNSFKTLDIRRQIIDVKKVMKIANEDSVLGIPWIQSIATNSSHATHRFIQEADLSDQFSFYQFTFIEPGDYFLLTEYNFDDGRNVFFGGNFFSVQRP